MNRIIKFRAWNGKDMKEVVSLYWHAGKIDNIVVPEGDSVDTLFSNFEVTQYTNNFDKNGKDIYHGDILKNPVSEGLLYEVQCYQGNFCIFIGEELFYLTDELCRKLEVVGNVFENSDLIEKPIDMSVFNNVNK